jgi:hypothetical protein
VTESTEWLTVPDVAEKLGITPGRVRGLIEEQELIAVRRGERKVLQIHPLMLVEDEEGARPLATLRGTLMMLGDAGLDSDGIVEWLTTANDELGESPLQALASGKRAPVRRAAQTLF